MVLWGLWLGSVLLLPHRENLGLAQGQGRWLFTHRSLRLSMRIIPKEVFSFEKQSPPDFLGSLSFPGCPTWARAEPSVGFVELFLPL